MTVFLGCGFAAKYPEGGGNFSVPLQWMLGLRRLGLDAIWLEILPATTDPREDDSRIRIFQRRLHAHGLGDSYCLFHQTRASDEHELGEMRCIGLSRHELSQRLAAPNTLLNLSYSLHPPFLLQFERRIFCDLDPSEIFFWMTKMEMGRNHPPTPPAEASNFGITRIQIHRELKSGGRNGPGQIEVWLESELL